MNPIESRCCGDGPPVMWSSSGRWSSRLGQDSRLRVGGKIRVVITFLLLLSQVASSCIVSKFEYEGTLAQPWPLGNCTGFYCFSRTLFASVGTSHEACRFDGFRMTMYLSVGYRGSSYSLWRVCVFCLLGTRVACIHSRSFCCVLVRGLYLMILCLLYICLGLL